MSQKSTQLVVAGVYLVAAIGMFTISKLLERNIRKKSVQKIINKIEDFKSQAASCPVIPTEAKREIIASFNKALKEATDFGDKGSVIPSMVAAHIDLHINNGVQKAAKYGIHIC